MSTSIDDVRAKMDAAYAGGADAFPLDLPFDTMRMGEIRHAASMLSSPQRNDNRAHVLDIGCGQGGIASYWPHAYTTGLDVSEEAIKTARARYPKCTFEVGAVENWSTSKSYGLVVAIESIEHWTDVDAGLSNIHGMLEPRGALVLTTPNRDSLHCRMARKLGFEAPTISPDHVHEFGYQELITRVKAHGFWLERSRGVALEPYWALESALGDRARVLTDQDPEVNRWLNDIGMTCDPQYAFIQCHRFVKSETRGGMKR